MTQDAAIMRLDAEALRVLAHPLRSRLLSALRLHGAATATDLAGKLGTNTGATSYHLRRLASVGLVEDTGDGTGRRRVWAPTTRSHSYTASDFSADPDASAALGWLSRHYVEQAAERMRSWFDAADAWPAEWRDACGLGDDAVLVTAEQARQMEAEIFEVIGRYRRAGEGDDAARMVLVGTTLSPVDPTEPPA